MARASAHPEKWKRLLELSMVELPRGSYNEPSEELKSLGDFFFGKRNRGGGSRAKPMLAINSDGVIWRFESRKACARHFQVHVNTISKLRRGEEARLRPELNDWAFIYEDELERG